MFLLDTAARGNNIFPSLLLIEGKKVMIPLVKSDESALFLYDHLEFTYTQAQVDGLSDIQTLIQRISSLTEIADVLARKLKSTSLKVSASEV